MHKLQFSVLKHKFTIFSESSLETISTEPFPQPLKKPTITKTSDTIAKPVTMPTPPIVDTTRTTPSLTTPHNPWPEDDILYQWRLARKMEKAQERVSTMRPTGQSAKLQRSQPGNYYDKIGSLPFSKSQTCHRIGAASSRILNQNDGMNPLDNAHEELNGVLLVDQNKMNAPGLGQILNTRKEEQPTLHGSIQTVSTSEPLPQSQGQTYSMDQYITASGPTKPFVTMPTAKHTVPPCTNAVSGVRATDVTIATGTMNRTVATPVVVPPCQHVSTSHPPGVPPHMHLSCDIIQCPCSDSPSKTNGNIKDGTSCAHDCKQTHKQDHEENELTDDQEYPFKQNSFIPSGHVFSHENRTTKTKTQKTTEKANRFTFPDRRDVVRHKHDKKENSREIETEFGAEGRAYRDRMSTIRDSETDNYQSVTSSSSNENGIKEKGVHKTKEKSKKTSDIVGNVIGKVMYTFQ